jgi:hypothetical protein
VAPDWLRVDILIKRKLRTPWHDGLIIATGLNAVVFAATLLWQAGFAEWGFVLLFGTSWLLISLFLLNDGFNEESGVMLARLLDHTVDQLLERIDQLEQALAARGEPGSVSTSGTTSVN